MAQEMGLLPGINEQNGPITAAEVAGKIKSDELLISTPLTMLEEPQSLADLISQSVSCVSWPV